MSGADSKSLHRGIVLGVLVNVYLRAEKNKASAERRPANYENILRAEGTIDAVDTIAECIGDGACEEFEVLLAERRAERAA